MDDNSRQRKEALEYALTETDRLIDMFSDVLHGQDAEKHPTRNFSGTAMKIMGIGTESPKPVSELVRDEVSDMDFRQLEECVGKCTKCNLCRTRKHVVFGVGCSDRPDVMVIGEGPGENEDEQGIPFVGKAGQFLDKWLAAISLFRDKNVFITNIVKCRPPMNRDPFPEEKKACLAFLKQQINLIQPRAILCLGKPASTELTGLTEASMGSLRGRFFVYDNTYPMICTYHPAAVLRDLTLKRAVWEDLQKLAKSLNLQIVTK